MEESLELYTCKASGPDTEFPAEGSRNITVPSSYNELATLMSVPGLGPTSMLVWGFTTGLLFRCFMGILFGPALKAVQTCTCGLH